MGKYLARFEWHHFATLTTARPTSSERLTHDVVDRFVRCLARKAQRSIRYFFAIEGGERLGGGHHHVHALIYGTADLTIRSIQQSWPLGFTAVMPYAAERGAAWYVAKHFDSDELDYEFSRLLPPPSTAVGRQGQ